MNKQETVFATYTAVRRGFWYWLFSLCLNACGANLGSKLMWEGNTEARIMVGLALATGESRLYPQQGEAASLKFRLLRLLCLVSCCSTLLIEWQGWRDDLNRIYVIAARLGETPSLKGVREQPRVWAFLLGLSEGWRHALTLEPLSIWQTISFYSAELLRRDSKTARDIKGNYNTNEVAWINVIYRTLLEANPVNLGWLFHLFILPEFVG